MIKNNIKAVGDRYVGNQFISVLRVSNRIFCEITVKNAIGSLYIQPMFNT